MDNEMIYSVVEQKVNMTYFGYFYVNSFKIIEGENIDKENGSFTRYVISGNNDVESGLLDNVYDVDMNCVNFCLLERLIRVFVDYDVLSYDTNLDIKSYDRNRIDFEITITDMRG